ncbi:hypothetical protein [Pelomonas sp. BJYL3]|uniref:hypothetical protein n=1 Tax=Pelomonas sp. BJYL3 TaxID=2976697 RepID=UPI0022B2AE56|nr:hypothetical protein [Pelomonas sp. BJYL3]
MDANRRRGKLPRTVVAGVALAIVTLVAVAGCLGKLSASKLPDGDTPWHAESATQEPTRQSTRVAATGAAPPPPLSDDGRAQDGKAGAQAPATFLTDWSRYPSGLMAALDQAVREQDGPAAYELVRILQRCERLPQDMERMRQQLSDLQTQGILMHKDRSFMDLLLSTMQQDHSHCQALSGDLKQRRRQLLEVAVRQGVDGAGMALFSAGVREPWVTRQVLREAERGDDAALAVLALGEIAHASRLQREAAGDALLRSASEPAADPAEDRRLRRSLEEIARQRLLQAWQADPGNPAKSAAAKAAYLGESVPPMQGSTDAQVLALADQYFAALTRRRRAPKA